MGFSLWGRMIGSCTSESVRITHADPSHPAKCLTPVASLPGLAAFIWWDVKSITAMSRQVGACRAPGLGGAKLHYSGIPWSWFQVGVLLMDRRGGCF